MNTYRKPLDFHSLPAIIQGMIEENSSAAAVIDELIQNKGENNALASLIILDDMNIRGVQINNLYKICDQNINKLYEKITNITKEDIDNLNFNSFAVCKYKAVFEGTKKDRKANPEKYIFTDEERNTIRNKKSKDRAHDILEERPNKDKEKNRHVEIPKPRFLNHKIDSYLDREINAKITEVISEKNKVEIK